MSVETTLLAAIGALCPRVFPDFAPAGTVTPYVVYHQIGGETIDPINGTSPGFFNSRIQVNVWHLTRPGANTLMRSIEDALRPHPINGRPIGALMSRADPSESIRGAQQDFSIWW